MFLLALNEKTLLTNANNRDKIYRFFMIDFRKIAFFGLLLNPCYLLQDLTQREVNICVHIADFEAFF